MFKKIGIATLITILVSVFASTIVSADTPDFSKGIYDRNRRMMIGQVLEIGSSDFTLEALNGDLQNIVITEETVFRSRMDEMDEASFSDLVVGMYIGVYAQEGNAKLVVLLPEDFDPGDIKAKRLIGEVNMVTVGGGFFKMDTRSGETLTVTIDENTRYAGGFSELSDLEKGDKIAVLAQEQEDNTLLAKVVVTAKVKRPKLDRQAGKFTDIDGQQITITGREGQAHTFTITGETRFISRTGDIQELEDLELEMILMVVFDPKSNSNQAKAIIVVDNILMNLERTLGEVHNNANGKLTVTTSGETLSFVVDENTRIRGIGIDELGDLNKGMKVLVLYKIEEDGSLLAKAILSGGNRERPPQPDLFPGN